MLGTIESIFRLCPPFVAPRLMAMSLRVNGLRLGRTSCFWGMPTFAGDADDLSRLTIGEACGFNFGCYFDLHADITILDHVSVGHEVLFLTRTSDGRNPGCRGGNTEAKPLRIESGVWLGARSIIMPGVTVGAGCVVAAATIVRTDLPPNTLLTGTRRVSLAKWR